MGAGSGATSALHHMETDQSSVFIMRPFQCLIAAVVLHERSKVWAAYGVDFDTVVCRPWAIHCYCPLEPMVPESSLTFFEDHSRPFSKLFLSAPNR
jgi:hypothetical protein